ncbi:MAG: mitofilin family membrane protein [Pseudomonadota bacterium]
MARKTKKSEEIEAARDEVEEASTKNLTKEGQADGASETIADAEVVEVVDPPAAADQPVEAKAEDDAADADDGDRAAEDDAGHSVEAGADEAEQAARSEQSGDVVSDGDGEVTSGDDTVHDRSDQSPEPAALAPAPPPTVVERRGPGVIALVFGGLIAGGIGWVVATYGPQTGGAVQNDGRIAALEQEIAALQSGSGSTTPTDLSGMESTIAEQADRLDALAARVETLETTGGASDQASGASTAAVGGGPGLDALRTDLDGLQDDVAALAGLSQTIEGVRSELSDRISALEGRIGEVAAEADTAEERAARAARDTAINQIVLALDTGQPYAEPLAVLDDAPSELAASAEDGVPAFSTLAADFPDVAREALRVSRSGETGGSLGSLAGRLLNARSVEPREGDDPDAILSRAEAALRASDLSGALTELDALPGEALDVMAGWIDRAETRLDAQVALQTYIQDE